MRISKKLYYHWFKNKKNTLVKTPKTYLKERIKIIFEDSREIYGSCRIQKKMEKEGLHYSRFYAGLLMK
jgi:putative transposase